MYQVGVIGRARTSELKPPFLLDLPILIITALLVSLSLVMVYSATGVTADEKLGDSFLYVRRQALAAVLGIALLIAGTRVPIRWIKKISPYCIFACLGLVALTLIPGIGDSAGGAHRWIKLGPLRFEPVESVKFLFVVFMAGYLSRQEKHMGNFLSSVVKPFLFVGLLGGLLLMQPDFGSTAVVALVTLCMITAAGAPYIYLASCGATLLAGMAMIIAISPYRMKRVVAFLSPFADASGKGYQLIQSLIAVGSGQVSGVGLGNSQQKLFYLPAAHTDFIFAVIAEELGFVGCLAVITLFVLFLWRGLRIARQLTDDLFCYALAVGLTMSLVIPAFLNMGVVTGLLPTKGLVLPLVGYGGSSLVASLAKIGLLLGLARHHYQKHT